MSKKTITGRIYEIVFQLLEKHPAGIRWSELLSMVESADSSLHPKTINGCIWKLVERYPDKIHKPSKGVFQLKKYAGSTSQDAQE